MKFKKNLHWFICILFTASCAKMTSPTGGPKDTIPPKLVKSSPQDRSTNYKGKNFELTFSEMIILNNPKEQIIITPSVGKDYEITANKNTVTLKLDKPLLDSTTYTLNFRDAVQDITEKNPLKNFKIAVSTGPYIDSLSIEGKIIDLLKGKEIKEATVAIHTKNDTFNILKHQATYFTKTNDKGAFKLDNLKPGTYYLYAFEDKNKNLTADSKNESYGFKKDSVILKTNLKDQTVGVTRLDARPLKITSARPYNTYFNIRTSKNIKEFSITAEQDSYSTFGEDHSNIRLYNNNYPDSIRINIKAADSIGNKIDTAIYAKFSKQEVTPEKFAAALTEQKVLGDKGQISATVKFNKPVKEFNLDSLYYTIDSTKTITFSKQDLTWDPTTNTIKIYKQVDKILFQKPAQDKKPKPKPTQKPALPTQPAKEKPEIRNQLYIGNATFISIENDSSKAISQTIKPLKTEELGMILFSANTKEKDIIVQLLDKNFNVKKTSINKTKGQFEDVEPGEYQLRVVIDNNKDGQWTPGNYLKKIEPEPIKYYESEKKLRLITLKANFELELLITY